MRVWLLTNTCYGTWLPGDRRGSVTSVRDWRPGDPPLIARIEHDIPGQLYEDEMPGLRRHAAGLLKSPPLFLDRDKADTLTAQFRETTNCRKWTVLAAAVMHNHWHMVVEVPGDPKPGKILADFKANGTRALNGKYGKPPSETWWTERGSKRILKGDQARHDGIHYVLRKQPNPLATWPADQDAAAFVPSAAREASQ